MKLAFVARGTRRRISLALTVLWLAAVPFCDAQDFSWHNTLGTITIFGSGDRATFLETTVAVADANGSDFLYYLNATGSPALSHSEAGAGSESVTAQARMSLDESETTGLPFVSGAIDFTNTGGGSGSGAVKLFYLINVPGPAEINLTGIRSAIMTAGSPAAAFSLALFQSDASGAKIGTALFSFSGNNFDQEASYESTIPYYLLEMDVAAGTSPISSDAVTFSFAIDLAEVAPVPEPATAVLLLPALFGLAIYRARKARDGQISPRKR